MLKSFGTSNRDNFASLILMWVCLFSCLLLLLELPTLCWVRVAKWTSESCPWSGQERRREKPSVVFALSVMSDIGFSYMTFIMLRDFLQLLVSWVFHHFWKSIRFCLNAFYASMERTVFPLPSLNVILWHWRCHVLNHPCLVIVNPTWLWCAALSPCCLVLFPSTLLRFVSVFIRDHWSA